MSRLEIPRRGILLVALYPLLTLNAGVLCRESSLTMGWAGIAFIGRPTLRSIGMARWRRMPAQGPHCQGNRGINPRHSLLHLLDNLAPFGVPRVSCLPLEGKVDREAGRMR